MGSPPDRSCNSNQTLLQLTWNWRHDLLPAGTSALSCLGGGARLVGGSRIHPGFSCFSHCRLQIALGNKFQRGLESSLTRERMHRPCSCWRAAVIEGERAGFLVSVEWDQTSQTFYCNMLNREYFQEVIKEKIKNKEALICDVYSYNMLWNPELWSNV